MLKDLLETLNPQATFISPGSDRVNGTNGGALHRVHRTTRDELIKAFERLNKIMRNRKFTLIKQKEG